MPPEAADLKPSAKPSRVDALLLTSVAGGVDAIGVLLLGGLFVAHMSGNTAAFGASFGQGQWSLGWPHFVAVPVFLAGLVFGYAAMIRRPTMTRAAILLVIEAGLLLVLAQLIIGFGGVPGGGWKYFLCVVPVVFAMGIQNATLRQIGRAEYPLTYVTGVLDATGKAAAYWLIERGEPTKAREHGRRFREAFSVWVAYVVGALAGSFGLLVLGHGILILPMAVLVLVAGRLFLLGRVEN